MTAQIEYKRLNATLNDIYTMDYNGASLELKLIAVSPLKEQGEFESFKLLFELPGAEVLGQKIYTLEHETLGKQDIFLVQVNSESEKDKTKNFYEAVFSRRKI